MYTYNIFCLTDCLNKNYLMSLRKYACSTKYLILLPHPSLFVTRVKYRINEECN